MSETDDRQPSRDPRLCRSCGACCGYFRILLDWTETADFDAGGIPLEMTAPHGGRLRVMAVTGAPRPQCVALEGEIGQFTTCRIHERRPRLCREFEPLEDGAVNPGCDEARAAWGLPPLDRRLVLQPADTRAERDPALTS